MFLLAGLVMITGLASAQNKTYTVQQGDTISEIANRHKVRRAELIAANSLPNSHRLQPGMKLRIPARRPEASPIAPPAGTTYYTVRNGDVDWTLAKKLGTTVATLKSLNPGVDFVKLPIGVRLAVPAGTKSLVASKPVTAKPAVTTAAPTKVATRTHKVATGENDWIIARHAGVSLTALRAANPGVNTEKLQIGQVLKVPVGSMPTSTVAKNTAKPTTSTPRKIKTPYAVVMGSGSTIRRSPSVMGDKITVADAGTQVKVLDHSNGWYKLRFPKGTEGWMRGDLIKPVSSTIIAKSKPKTTVAKAAPKSSTTKRSIVASRPRTTVAKRGSRPSLAAGPASSDLIKTAYSQLGTPYKWGSTSRSNGGYDCSGFVTYVYKSKGVKLPRTSRDMSRAGQSVSTKSLKSGDLVFFKTGRSSRINHVGMYVGNGKFIHSSSGQGGVRIDSLNSGYYSRKLVTARRVAKVSPAKPAAPTKPAAPKADAE